MRKKYGLQFLIVILIIFLFSNLALAEVEIGGEIKTTVNSSIYENKTLNSLQEKLNLELFLPQLEKTDAKFEIDITKKPNQSNLTYFIKKMYLKHKFNKIYLTAGRQPISWSFGSLINPVDYNPGAVVMDQETNGKYQDAVEGYLPLNWNSNISVVAGFPETNDSLKWGVRGRTGINGYDLTINYVKDPKSFLGVPLEQIGATVKGDLGSAGVYGAVGQYYFDVGEETVTGSSVLLGTDYSFYTQAGFGNKTTLQAEYIGINGDNIATVLEHAGGTSSGLSLWSGLDSILNEAKYIDFLLGNYSYEIDEFSQLNLMTVMSLDDGSIMLTPRYTNQLGSSLEFTISSSIFIGESGTLFKPELTELGYGKMNGTVQAELSYIF